MKSAYNCGKRTKNRHDITIHESTGGKQPKERIPARAEREGQGAGGLWSGQTLACAKARATTGDALVIALRLALRFPQKSNLFWGPQFSTIARGAPQA